MANFKTKLDRAELNRIGFSIRGIPDFVKEADARALGELVIPEIKSLAIKGISPIEGRGRFEGYLGAGKPDKYPATVRKDFSNKGDRPVNLTLSGKFLASLIGTPYKAKNGYGVDIGFDSDLSDKKEQGHREGVRGQPSRPILPKGSETFAQTIQQIIVGYYQKLLAVKLKRL